MKRKVYHLVHTSDDGHWHLKLEDVEGFIGSFTTKERGLERGRELGACGDDAQLIVHREDGSSKPNTPMARTRSGSWAEPVAGR